MCCRTKHQGRGERATCREGIHRQAADGGKARGARVPEKRLLPGGDGSNRRLYS